MNNLHIYTFSTNPYRDHLKTLFDDVFVFRRLHDDFRQLAVDILKRKPRHVLGIAHFKYQIPRFEPTAINQFHKRGRITKTGPEKYPLFIPKLEGTPFRTSATPSDSFCNWTMYKIANFLAENNLQSKLMFVHMKERYLDSLVDVIDKLR